MLPSGVEYALKNATTLDDHMKLAKSKMNDKTVLMIFLESDLTYNIIQPYYETIIEIVRNTNQSLNRYHSLPDHLNLL